MDMGSLDSRGVVSQRHDALQRSHHKNRGASISSERVSDVLRDVNGVACEEPLDAEVPRSGCRFAFVTMAHDEAGSPGAAHLWSVLPLARSLQRLSQYPLMVLSNNTRLPDGTDFAEALSHLRVTIVPVKKLVMPGSRTKHFQKQWEVAYWKLQAWRLTQFDKVIWIDSDAIVTRKIDWIFGESRMWGQSDDATCSPNVHLCSGLLSLAPSVHTYEAILSYASSLKKIEKGDQELIERYFQSIGEPVSLLSSREVAFGWCLNNVPVLPAVVHKSSTSWDTTQCFSQEDFIHKLATDTPTLNRCQRHLTGFYWHQMLCEAAHLTETHDSDLQTVCSIAWPMPIRASDPYMAVASSARGIREGVERLQDGVDDFLTHKHAHETESQVHQLVDDTLELTDP